MEEKIYRDLITVTQMFGTYEERFNHPTLGYIYFREDGQIEVELCKNFPVQEKIYILAHELGHFESFRRFGGKMPYLLLEELSAWLHALEILAAAKLPWRMVPGLLFFYLQTQISYLRYCVHRLMNGYDIRTYGFFRNGRFHVVLKYPEDIYMYRYWFFNSHHIEEVDGQKYVTFPVGCKEGIPENAPLVLCGVVKAREESGELYLDVSKVIPIQPRT